MAGEGVVTEVVDREMRLEPAGRAGRWQSRNARVVDQEVDAAVRQFPDTARCGTDVIEVGEIHRHRRYAPPEAQTAGGGPGFIRAACDEHHMGFSRGKLLGESESHTRASAGDDCCQTGELRHVGVPPPRRVGSPAQPGQRWAAAW